MAGDWLDEEIKRSYWLIFVEGWPEAIAVIPYADDKRFGETFDAVWREYPDRSIGYAVIDGGNPDAGIDIIWQLRLGSPMAEALPDKWWHNPKMEFTREHRPRQLDALTARILGRPATTQNRRVI